MIGENEEKLISPKSHNIKRPTNVYVCIPEGVVGSNDHTHTW